MKLMTLPLEHRLLERYRLEGRRKLRPDLLGGHLVRRKGQSLEFREYEHYLPGDDIRHVDWRASARYGKPADLLVRSFVAEERMTLILSLDTRATMYLPESMSKLQIGAWLTEAIATVALRGGNRVILHRLFGEGADGVVSLRGDAMRHRVRPTLQRYCETPQQNEALDLKRLQRFMPPSAVWLVLSDYYFHETATQRQLASGLARAHDGLRWLLLLDLDSWPMEQRALGEGARLLEGPGLESHDPHFEIDAKTLERVAAKIQHHKKHFQEMARAHRFDQISWPWPEQPADPEQFFRSQFLADQVLQRLFMRDKT